ncbi:putative heme-binding protein 2 [Triplophysa rosa]|uniref:Heme-binding protein 2 n=1 Tax=Triplophysa rosa TaxID=992332 RepID=A0A9W8C8G3_TRIRA|nr:putative heme-binding protein 2 [Triplophysa rosa]
MSTRAELGLVNLPWRRYHGNGNLTMQALKDGALLDFHVTERERADVDRGDKDVRNLLLRHVCSERARARGREGVVNALGAGGRSAGFIFSSVYPTAMILVSCVTVLMLFGLTDSSVGPSNSSSSYCTESRECLQFDLICKTDQYEVRRYSSTRWVSTDAEAYFLGVGAAMAFRRLYHYISGENEEGVMFEMTAPVLVKVPEETKMWEPAIYTLSFLLPSAYQEKPPTPTNDKVRITTRVKKRK